MGAVRVLSGVANLASIFHFSNPFSFRDMTFFHDFFKKNSKTGFKNSKTLMISILLLDIVRVLSGISNVAFDYGCSNARSFRDTAFFLEFFRKLRYKKLNKTLNYHHCSEALSGYLQELRISPPNMTA